MMQGTKIQHLDKPGQFNWCVGEAVAQRSDTNQNDCQWQSFHDVYNSALQFFMNCDVDKTYPTAQTVPEVKKDERRGKEAPVLGDRRSQAAGNPVRPHGKQKKFATGFAVVCNSLKHRMSF